MRTKIRHIPEGENIRKFSHINYIFKSYTMSGLRRLVIIYAIISFVLLVYIYAIYLAQNRVPQLGPVVFFSSFFIFPFIFITYNARNKTISTMSPLKRFNERKIKKSKHYKYLISTNTLNHSNYFKNNTIKKKLHLNLISGVFFFSFSIFIVFYIIYIFILFYLEKKHGIKYGIDNNLYSLFLRPIIIYLILFTLMYFWKIKNIFSEITNIEKTVYLSTYVTCYYVNNKTLYLF